ncbi:MAG: Hsp20/alpha crystallin family protein [Kiritimatiellia bacterium]|jgi:HSP20 family protein
MNELAHFTMDPLRLWNLFDFPYRADRSSNEVRPTVGLSAFPRIWIRETDKGLTLDAELPGVAPEDLDVTVEGDELTLSGKRRLLGRTEEETETFSRTLKLPFTVDPSAIQAEARHGILTLALPRVSGEQRHKIPIVVA